MSSKVGNTGKLAGSSLGVAAHTAYMLEPAKLFVRLRQLTAEGLACLASEALATRLQAVSDMPVRTKY